MRTQGGMRSESGFTLAELVVVIVLIGIMAGAATSGLMSMVRSVRVKTAAQDVFSSLLLTRSEAIKRNVNVTMTPSAAGWAGGWDISVGAELIQPQQPLRGVTFTNAPVAVTYTRNGRLPLGGARPRFEIKAANSSEPTMRCVIVDLDGGPRTIKGGC